MAPLRRALLCAATVALGCGEIGAPVRYECTDAAAPSDRCAYDFRHPDGFVFRWLDDRQPVRIWVEPLGNLPRLVEEGATRWSSSLLYDELRTVFVTDSSQADIIVIGLTDRVGAPNGPACAGFSEAAFLLAGDTVIAGDTIGPLTLLGPITTFVWGYIGESGEAVRDCLEIVVPHELGHGLGLLAHSSDSDDLMAPNPRFGRLSERDRVTFEMLYHTPPSIKPPRR